MNKKAFLSVLIIVLAVASVGGATAAWFTDSEELTNTFSAGTLDITAVDGWKGLTVGEVWKNVNPGDCKDKNFTIKNVGSKHALIRLKYTGAWVGGGDAALVTVTAPAGWYKHTDNYYYYTAGPLVPLTGEVKFDLKVCVAGKEMDNTYQGKSFKIDFTVEAIQASNNASGQQWLVNSTYNSPPSQLATDWNGFVF